MRDSLRSKPETKQPITRRRECMSRTKEQKDSAKANAEAQSRFNKSQDKKGLKRIEIRGRPEDEDKIKAYVKKLNKKAGIG